MKNANSDIHYSERVLNSGIFYLEEMGQNAEPSIGIYQLNKTDHSKLSESFTIPSDKANRITSMAQNLTDILIKYESSTNHHTVDDYIKEIESDLYKVLEDHHFPKTEAKEYIRKILKNKSFRQMLLDTGAYEETAKNHNKYFNLYLPLYQVFCRYILKHYSSKRPQDKIYYYVAHFLVGSGIEKRPVKNVYNQIRKAINRFEKDNPAYKRFRKKFETE